MGKYKYVIFLEPLNWILNIEKILQIVNWDKVEFLIDNKNKLEEVLDSFWEDWQKIYNILTNIEVKKWMKLIVDKVDDILIPEWIYAEFIDEDKLNRIWAKKMWNTIVLPSYHMNPNGILI